MAIANGGNILPKAHLVGGLKFGSAACGSPNKKNDVRLGFGYFFVADASAGFGNEACSGQSEKFGDPRRRSDSGIWPGLGVDTEVARAVAALADWCKFLGHFCDKFVRGESASREGTELADVALNLVESL